MHFGEGASSNINRSGVSKRKCKIFFFIRDTGVPAHCCAPCVQTSTGISNILSLHCREDVGWGGGGGTGYDCMNYSRASGGKLLFLIGSQIQISHFKQMGKINVIKLANLAAVLVPLHFP